ncbi:hypothetical protein HJFPF1_11236 [Paramyrothecium foliicola]|nr:hypothetical protein HJFPF1_11236 [Paramyrothecium foliicola]
MEDEAWSGKAGRLNPKKLLALELRGPARGNRSRARQTNLTASRIDELLWQENRDSVASPEYGVGSASKSCLLQVCKTASSRQSQVPGAGGSTMYRILRMVHHIVSTVQKKKNSRQNLKLRSQIQRQVRYVVPPGPQV